jgi:hypothetical protein
MRKCGGEDSEGRFYDRRGDYFRKGVDPRNHFGRFTSYRAISSHERLREEALKIINLLRKVGEDTNWKDREQTDRVFAWYEFDGLRAVLEEGGSNR